MVETALQQLSSGKEPRQHQLSVCNLQRREAASDDDDKDQEKLAVERDEEPPGESESHEVDSFQLPGSTSIRNANAICILQISFISYQLKLVSNVMSPNVFGSHVPQTLQVPLFLTARIPGCRQHGRQHSNTMEPPTSSWSVFHCHGCEEFHRSSGSSE